VGLIKGGRHAPFEIAAVSLRSIQTRRVRKNGAEQSSLRPKPARSQPDLGPAGPEVPIFRQVRFSRSRTWLRCSAIRSRGSSDARMRLKIKELPSNLKTYPIRIDGKTLLIKLTHDPRDPFRACCSAAAFEAGEAGLNGRAVGGDSRRTK
jgi:hypothetical protein